MATAQGTVFPFEPVDNIRTDLLEVFPYTGDRQFITYETREFSAVCPFSGLPDVGTVRVEYIPKGLCVELKSLKYYYVSFRPVGIYQEAVTDRICRDLFDILQPEYLKLTTIYNTRGGIDTTCVMEKGRRGV